jgi:tetratricopeptide (TPR) repeat protein
MKSGRNDPCGCGSGRKHKKCCAGDPSPLRSLPDLSRLFAEARRERREGRLERAGQLYQEILAADPRHAQALHEFGGIAILTGRTGQAVELLRQAVAINPASAACRSDLGAALQSVGKLEEAAAEYPEALRLAPDFVDALSNFGGVLCDLGRPEAALPHLEKALALAPSHLTTLTNLALALHTLGRSEEALQHSRYAVDLAPASVAAVERHAGLLSALLRWQEAQPFCELSVSLDPENFAVYLGLGDCYTFQQLHHEAARCYWKALQLKPDCAAAANNLGTCLTLGGCREEALTLFTKAAELKPDDAMAWSNLGVAALDLGDPEMALQYFTRALALNPAQPEALWNRSHSLLSLGRLAEGWEAYEWRWKGQIQARPFPQPRWDGSKLYGKTILVWMEQGLGDQIGFASILPDLCRAGAHCIVEADWRLMGLLKRSMPGVETFPTADPPCPRTREPEIDFQIPAGSLPRFLRTTLENFPREPSYLIPDSTRAAEFGRRVAALGDGLKVGICWRSKLNRERRSVRYAPLDQWRPILTQPGIQFINLQYHCGQDELLDIQREFGTAVHGWDDLDLTDDQDGVAALISTLDLVVTAPTAVPELAGAVGVPTWILARKTNDWTCLGQNYNPWHPTLRYFYCETTGRWEPAVAALAAELAGVAQGHALRTSLAIA